MISREDIWWVEEVFDDDTIQIVNDSFKVKPSKKAFEEANRMDFIEVARLREELQELGVRPFTWANWVFCFISVESFTEQEIERSV